MTSAVLQIFTFSVPSTLVQFYDKHSFVTSTVLQCVTFSVSSIGSTM